MCRHAAYVGPPLRLDRFLLEPPHGLVEQAYKPREMLTAELNADGFGVGWFGPDGRPGIYTNPMPIWSDINIQYLARVLTSTLWVGNVRSATVSQPVSQANTHPFADDRAMFSHNGFIRDFAKTARTPLRAFLSPDIDASIRGNTDSEHLFAALRQTHQNAGRNCDLVDATRDLLERVAGWIGTVPGLLNIMVAEPGRVVAARHAINHAAPTLYVGTDPTLFPGGWLIASEPLTESGDWRAVPDHHLVVMSDGVEPAVVPI